MSEKAKPSAVASFIKRIAHADGWKNIATGLGLAAKDKRMSASVEYSRMSESEVEDLYAADDVAATMVDTLPEDALRQWVAFQGFEPDQARAVENELDALGLPQRLDLAWKWARMYGGSAIFINVDDGRFLDQPLEPGLVRSVRSLVVFSRYELQPREIDTDINSRTYGRPLQYMFTPRRADTSGNGTMIHHTRLMRFDGAKLPLRQEMANNYWGESILGRAFNAIRNYNVSHDAAATILQEFNQGIFKIKNLADLLMGGDEGEKAVQNRLETVQLSRSVCRAVVIDRDEEFQNMAASVTGIPEMLAKVGQRLVVASKMPHTKILGESPSGLGATGDSEQGNWYDHVQAQQEQVLRPKISYVVTLLLRSRQGPTSGKVPPNWTFEFNPLEQESEGEQVKNRNTQAQTDEIYIRNGVVDPDEVAASRFGSGKYSFETTIDNEARDTATTPEIGGKPGTAASGLENVQTQALNGAQVASLLETVGQAARGDIPRDAAVEIIIAAYQVDRATAERMLGSAAFTPTPPPAKPLAGGAT
jgi:phage-related protein (TIGR01555 family)